MTLGDWRCVSYHLAPVAGKVIMQTREYRVSLEMFGGPMDLLLYLVRRNEVDILELPLAKIAAQFVEFLEVLQLLDVDLAAEFVATASTLAEIKSRTVLPRQEEPEAEQPLDEEPPSDLVRKLMEYKRLRDASQALDEHAARSGRNATRDSLMNGPARSGTWPATASRKSSCGTW